MNGQIFRDRRDKCGVSNFGTFVIDFSVAVYWDGILQSLQTVVYLHPPFPSFRFNAGVGESTVFSSISSAVF